MGNIIVTFENDGIPSISDYTGSTYTNDEICKLIHTGNIRKQMVDDLKKGIKSQNLEDVSTTSLGYVLETIHDKKYYSKLSNIEFHNGNVSLNNFRGCKH